MARLIGKGQSTVQHWAKTGHIPPKWQSELLRVAREAGIDVVPGDFVALSDPSHTVQFYEDDAFLVDKVAQFIGSGLESGNSGVVIATEAHREGIARSLRRRGFDASVTSRKGSYIALDAAATLEQFMVDGRPDKGRFFRAIEPLIAQANTAKCVSPRVAVFGEMVALLWTAGNRTAAIELEQFWNELSERASFSLCCGYPMQAFNRAEHRQAFAEICANHVDVIPAESYSALTKESERRRTVARLQQKLQALEAEIRISEERSELLRAAAGLGTWEMNLIDDSISLSSEAQEMLGVERRELFLKEFLALMLYSGDREGFQSALRKARIGRKELAAQIRVGSKNRVRVVSIRAKTFYNAGQPLMLGIFQDLNGVRN